MVNGRHFEKCYHSILVTPRCDKIKINDEKTANINEKKAV